MPPLYIKDIGSVLVVGKASTLSQQLRAIARMYGAQDMFSDCANFQPGLSKQVMK